MPKVFIIIVNYNGYKDTRDCIESLLEIVYENYEIIGVDNGSTDESMNLLNGVKNEKVVVLDAKDNLGSSGGNNLGIGYAFRHQADYVLLLNNDTVVEKDFLSKLIDCAGKYQNHAVISPKIMYDFDRNIIWYAGGETSKYTTRTIHTGIHSRDIGQFEKEKEVTFISGCCMLIPLEVLKTVGKMKEDYFLYCEDLDYCYQIRNKGYHLIYCPDAKIYHKVSASTGQQSDMVTYYIVRNKRYIIDRYTRGIQWLLAKIYNFAEEKKRVLTKEYNKNIVQIAKNDYKNKIIGIKYNENKN